MHKPKLALLMSATVLLTTTALFARLSPHDTINSKIDNNLVIVVYGRPYMKDHKTGDERKIWGGLVPYGKVWRLGADEATLFTTQKPLKIGDTTVPAGAYTLFMLPEENGTSKLIINKQVGQWGLQYDQKQDLARIDLKKEALDKPVEQFTISLDTNPDGGGLIKLSWENTSFSVPFTLAK